jgi:hypothetical protein
MVSMSMSRLVDGIVWTVRRGPEGGLVAGSSSQKRLNAEEYGDR